MKKFLLVFVLLGSVVFAETGNQVTMSDLKEAVFKLIVENKQLSNKVRDQKIVYKELEIGRSDLDPLIANFVRENKHLINRY